MKTKTLLVSLAILIASWFPIITTLATLFILGVLWARLAKEFHDLDHAIGPMAWPINKYRIGLPLEIFVKLFNVLVGKQYREDVIKYYKTKLKFPV